MTKTLKRVFADLTTNKGNEAVKGNPTKDKGKRKAASLAAPASKKPKKTTIPLEERQKRIEKWGKAALSECAKTKVSEHDGREPFTVTVRDENQWSLEEFQDMFVGRGKGGRKKAPNKKTKKDSEATTIIRFENYDKLKMLCGEEHVHLIPTTGYRALSVDSKSETVGHWPARMLNLEAHYHQKNGTLDLKFGLVTGMCYDSLDSDPAALEDLKKTYTFVSGGPEHLF